MREDERESQRQRQRERDRERDRDRDRERERRGRAQQRDQSRVFPLVKIPSPFLFQVPFFLHLEYFRESLL